MRTKAVKVGKSPTQAAVVQVGMVAREARTGAPPVAAAVPATLTLVPDT
jgi:hypothetical protein